MMDFYWTSAGYVIIDGGEMAPEDIIREIPMLRAENEQLRTAVLPELLGACEEALNWLENQGGNELPPFESSLARLIANLETVIEKTRENV